MGGLRTVSKEEMEKHSSEDDCWIIMWGKVYDVSNYMVDHPGGPDVIVNLAGQDATEEFEGYGHSDDARKIADELCVGVLEGADVKSSWSAMSALGGPKVWLAAASITMAVGVGLMVATRTMAAKKAA
ncbi:unnamed protein product [Vitrella brassicaformis CCMP3155]|uniref:Cytochrome b5 heme-binding domain-containing protein n=1 Tax=Vitrella brassicaformis (strain CCMP3155) TaxID=1169540 RepID=A0A0G4EDK3_VITBC|nr:unnamed protein product [Vitrella brassicaformis CCMP3155]|mmetsp:Transcript_54019/g.135804  ORF Transcript_54019/g.135804 Transcript_54019/m.135804 type:complete len:128 (-) Transcript_54019:534-917(-)|eukprot:CEL93590.1 unnamed protein product [Vitrella brassicaformis CCMP3155]